MKDWELSLDKFISEYKKLDNVVGIILTGSYATGNNTINSDIDVFIVTDDNTKWRERGTKLVDGYLIEYFINPVRQVLKEIEECLTDYGISTNLIFIGSKTLYDRNGTIDMLKKKAQEYLDMEFNDVRDFNYKMNSYTVWHSFYELESKYLRKLDIDYSYYLYLDNIITGYFYNNKIPRLPQHKVEKILKDEEFRKRYNVFKLPDSEFINLLINCFDEKDYDKRYEVSKKLYDYYMNSVDFDINDFSLRSELD